MAVTIGILMDQLFNQVQGVINGATAAGNLLEIEAGVQVRQSIDYARDAYQASMNETMNRVDRLIREKIEAIESIVLDLQRHQADQMRDIMRRAHAVATMLPFADRRPQFTYSVPRSIRIEPRRESVYIRLFGNFVQIPGNQRQPSLQFDAFPGHAAPPAALLRQHQLDRLEFEINPQVVFPNWARDRVVTDQIGELRIPWVSDGLISRQLESVFRVSLAALPQSPGSITLHWTVKRKVEELAPSRYSSPNQHVGSSKSEDNADHPNHLFRATPREGWKIQKGSSKVEWLAHGVVELPTCVIETENEVVYRGSTSHKRLDSSGVLDVTISFQEYRVVDREFPFRREIDLNWDQSTTLNYYREEQEGSLENPLLRWRVDFTSFDYLREGVQHRISSPQSVRGLDVRAGNGDVTIRAVIPEELQGNG